jgi:hypothetical protein
MCRTFSASRVYNGRWVFDRHPFSSSPLSSKPMKRAQRLEILQRQIAWQSRFALTIVEDLEEAAAAHDQGAACYLLQAFAAACLTLAHQLWPGGRRLTDQIIISSAFDLRESLSVEEPSLLSPENLAPLGITLHFTQADCTHFFDLGQLVVDVDGERFRISPLIDEVRALWDRAALKAGKVPVVN